MTPNNRREGIIPITHTEIMLVLAVVILLLLVATHQNWSARFALAEDTVALLQERENLSPDALAEQQRQLDLGRQVKEALVGGGVALGDEQTSLTPEDVTAVNQLVENNDRTNQALAEVVETINKVGSENDSQVRQQSEIVSPAQRIKQLAANARIWEIVRRTMEAADQSVVDDSASIEEIEGWARRILGHTATPDNAGAGDLVGFNPCWPGDSTRDDRRYYFTYDLTYADSRYHIESHPDWNQDKPVVDAALSGNLAILQDYPTEAVSPADLVTFGRLVERTLAPLRQIDSGNDYPSDCRLAVTLNAEAPLSVAEFIYVNVGFYPVIR